MALFALAQRGQFYPSYHFSSGLISSLCQDRLGSLWIGTDYGLNRFDGYHFQTFLHDDADSTSLVANVVVSLLCDPSGHLWVGTNNGLDCYDADRDEFRHYPFPDGIRPRVSSIILRKDGSLLIGTAGFGAYTLANADGKLQSYEPLSGEDYCSRLFEDSKGRLWSSGFDQFITMYDGTKVQHFHSEMGNC
jgi:ligand-binding sensor domain-containing protein